MSSEGHTLIARTALVAMLIVAAAVVRTFVGPSKRRGLYMGIGFLGGMATGIAAAALMSRWIVAEVSAVFACLGIVAGWAVAWRFARRIPRNLH